MDNIIDIQSHQLSIRLGIIRTPGILHTAALVNQKYKTSGTVTIYPGIISGYFSIRSQRIPNLGEGLHGSFLE